MIEIALDRIVSWDIASTRVRQAGQGDISHGRQGKSADVRRADVVGRVGDLRHREKSSAGAFSEMPGKSTFPAPSPVPDAWKAR